MLRKIVIFVLFLTFSAVLYAQTAVELEAVLESSAVTYAQAASFVLNSADLEFQGSAFEYAVEKGWIKKAEQDDPVKLGALSFLLMQVFEIKGGMMYTLFPGPRYAYRSMINSGFIQGVSDPAMLVNGQRFLLILGKVLSAEGDE